MGITSKVQICAMALSHMGVFEDINDIDSPKSDKEVVFSLWYDVTRQALLRSVLPHFAAKRAFVAQIASPARVSGFAYAYQMPPRCLRLLGIGDIEDKENNYTVEGGLIHTDDTGENGLPVRYVFDEEDVTKFSSDFIIQFSWDLASHTCMAITQDARKAQAIVGNIDKLKIGTAAVLAQENRPVRKRTSRIRLARHVGHPVTDEKR